MTPRRWIVFFVAIATSFPFSTGACSRRVTTNNTPTLTIKKAELTPGDTLGQCVADLGLPPPAQQEIITHLGALFNLRTCRVGDHFEVAIDSTARWHAFDYFPAGLEYYSLRRSTAGAVSAERRTKQGTRVQRQYAGVIETSLWEAMAARGCPPELIMSFADIFSWQIDFLTEPRAGDRYRLVTEEFVAPDNTILTSTIQAAQYLASGKTHTGILFSPAGGTAEYFDIDGTSLQSAFLRAPLQFRRISSFFSRARFHPVLKRYRPHLGIDYAAPSGTPVSSIGEGVVRFAGRKGGFGNYVIISHPNSYTSHYGHLKGFARGVRAGRHVQQGQVIGYVGSTGLSTGPHLDFRVTHHNSFINFLALKTPAARSIAPADRDAFKSTVRDSLAELANIR